MKPSTNRELIAAIVDYYESLTFLQKLVFIFHVVLLRREIRIPFDRRGNQ